MDKLKITVTGDGPALLLIHGMGSASTAWKPIRSQLNRSFTVITADLPGHGESRLIKGQAMDPHSLATYLINALEEFDAFHIAGNSLGGWISLEMASSFPERVLSVTALAPAGLWLNPYNARYPGTALARFLSRYTHKVAPTALHFEAARRIGFSELSPRWRDFSYQLCLDATLAMAVAEGYYPAWDGMLMKRFDGSVPEKIPVTIVFGDSDGTLPPTTCQERSLAPEHSRWVLFPETGHAPMWDCPQDVIEQIRLTSQI